MEQQQVILEPIKEADREKFIWDAQDSFRYGLLEEFGVRNNRLEADGEVISKEMVESVLDAPGALAYHIVADGAIAGGIVVNVNEKEKTGDLELLFTLPDVHSKGVGYGAWTAVERMFPDIRKWSTVTPCFETRNIHFYVNRCGFHIVEYYNKKHPYIDVEGNRHDDYNEYFRFEKTIK